MKWMKERDLLIAQTMAFVQSVTGKKPDAKLFANNPAASSEAFRAAEAPSVDAPAAFIPDIDALLADTTIAVAPPKPVARPDVRVDFQSEIKARVANFRAHQERFHREREAYCSATMAKVHAALREDAVPPRLGK
jgi:LmbE family N-acetylglucosaminyl deacetylase